MYDMHRNTCRLRVCNAYSATVRLVLLQELLTQKALLLRTRILSNPISVQSPALLAEKQHFSASVSLRRAVAIVGFHQVLV